MCLPLGEKKETELYACREASLLQAGREFDCPHEKNECVRQKLLWEKEGYAKLQKNFIFSNVRICIL